MLNEANIIGFLGRDPEVRYMPNGDAVANLAIATTEKWKDKQTGEQKEATEWHRVTFYGRTAEVCSQYLAKGTLVYVSGKLTTKKWTDKNGIEKYTTEITGKEMKILRGGLGKDAEAPSRPQQSRSAAEAQDDFGSDDIPF